MQGARRTRRFLITGLCAAMLGACGGSSGTPSTSVAGLVWTLCGEVECATVDVPADYDDPTAGTYTLAVTRHVATGGDAHLGVLFVNAGGPGLPGRKVIQNAPLFLSKTLLDRFDIVSWDPRGTGESLPAFDCGSSVADAIGLADPVGARTRQRTWVDGCVTAAAGMTGHMSTTDSARDMETIRRSLGVSTASFLGYSYGAQLGLTWANLFPRSVRALVFDSPPDPGADEHSLRLSQATSFESAWNRFVKRYPAAATAPERLDHSLLSRAAVAALGTTAAWTRLADAITASVKGDDSGLRGLWDEYMYVGSQDLPHAVDARYATLCADRDAHTEVADQETVARKIMETAPVTGAVFANDFVCGMWPVHGRPATFTVEAPAVVIGALDDPVSPYEGVKEFALALSNARVVTVATGGHGSYLRNECATAAADELLVTLKGPALDSAC